MSDDERHDRVVEARSPGGKAARAHPYERAVRSFLRLRGFRSDFLETEEGRLHVLHAAGTGTGPPLLAVHGFGSGGMPFGRSLLRLRSASRRVGVLESPGHGFSDVPAAPLTPGRWVDAVHHALDALGQGTFAPRPVLLGNSLGGALVLRYALAHPERVRALVLCSPAGAPLSPAELADLRRLFNLDSAGAAREFVRRLFAHPPWYIDAAAPEVRRRLTSPTLRGFLQAVDTDETFTAETLRGLKVPVLLLWGEGDRILPASGLTFFQSLASPHFTVEVAPRVGHCPQIERPAWLAERVACYLATLTP